jgi:hypothetical protein
MRAVRYDRVAVTRTSQETWMRTSWPPLAFLLAVDIVRSGA